MCYHCKGHIVFGVINSVILFVIVSVAESRAPEIEPLLKVRTSHDGMEQNNWVSSHFSFVAV